LPAAHYFHNKFLPTAHFFPSKILSVGHLISVSYLDYQFIGFENDSKFKYSVITTTQFVLKSNKESIK